MRASARQPVSSRGQRAGQVAVAEQHARARQPAHRGGERPQLRAVAARDERQVGRADRHRAARRLDDGDHADPRLVLQPDDPPGARQQHGCAHPRGRQPDHLPRPSPASARPGPTPYAGGPLERRRRSPPASSRRGCRRCAGTKRQCSAPRARATCSVWSAPPDRACPRSTSCSPTTSASSARAASARRSGTTRPSVEGAAVEQVEGRQAHSRTLAEARAPAPPGRPRSGAEHQPPAGVPVSRGPSASSASPGACSTAPSPGTPHWRGLAGGHVGEGGEHAGELAGRDRARAARSRAAGQAGLRGERRLRRPAGRRRSAAARPRPARACAARAAPGRGPRGARTPTAPAGSRNTSAPAARTSSSSCSARRSRSASAGRTARTACSSAVSAGAPAAGRRGGQGPARAPSG